MKLIHQLIQHWNAMWITIFNRSYSCFLLICIVQIGNDLVALLLFSVASPRYFRIVYEKIKIAIWKEISFVLANFSLLLSPHLMSKWHQRRHLIISVQSRTMERINLNGWEKECIWKIDGLVSFLISVKVISFWMITFMV